MVSRFHVSVVAIVGLFGANYAFALETTRLLPLHTTSLVFCGLLGLFLYKRVWRCKAKKSKNLTYSVVRSKTSVSVIAQPHF